MRNDHLIIIRKIEKQFGRVITQPNSNYKLVVSLKPIHKCNMSLFYLAKLEYPVWLEFLFWPNPNIII